jgi:hypothetical protein
MRATDFIHGEVANAEYLALPQAGVSRWRDCYYFYLCRSHDRRRQNKFDGKWTVNNSSETCMVKRDTWTLIVHNGAVTAAGKFPPTGSISESGESHWTRAAKKDGLPVTYSGTFKGNAGSGTYVSSARVPCAGRFSAARK